MQQAGNALLVAKLFDFCVARNDDALQEKVVGDIKNALHERLALKWCEQFVSAKARSEAGGEDDAGDREAGWLHLYYLT